jgi:hypothetical protein
MHRFHEAVAGVERHHHSALGVAPGDEGHIGFGLDAIEQRLEALAGLGKTDDLIALSSHQNNGMGAAGLPWQQQGIVQASMTGHAAATALGQKPVLD